MGHATIPKLSNDRLCAGMSLIELMISLAVIAVTISLMSPSFNQAAANSRLDTATETIRSATRLARSESIKRGGNVSLAPTTPSNWASGLSVNATALIRRFSAVKNVTAASASGCTNPNQINLNGSGQLTAQKTGATCTTVITIALCASSVSRTLSIQPSGTITTQSGTC